MIPENIDAKPWRNQKFVILLIAILAISAIVIVSILRDRIVNNQQWQISVVGQGKVSYQPDIAVVLLGVQIDKAANAESALNLLNQRTDKIIEAVKEIGVNEEDINTQGFSVYAHYDYIENISAVTGYDASQQLAIKVRDINTKKELVSQTINIATKAGANKVDGITFEVSDLENLKQQARLEAIGNAKSKAGVLAAAADVKLKRVVGWWDNVIQAPGVNQTYYYDGKGGAGGTSAGSVPTGLQEIIIEVSLNYQIK